MERIFIFNPELLLLMQEKSERLYSVFSGSEDKYENWHCSPQGY